MLWICSSNKLAKCCRLNRNDSFIIRFTISTWTDTSPFNVFRFSNSSVKFFPGLRTSLFNIFRISKFWQSISCRKSYVTYNKHFLLQFKCVAGPISVGESNIVIYDTSVKIRAEQFWISLTCVTMNFKKMCTTWTMSLYIHTYI